MDANRSQLQTNRATRLLAASINTVARLNLATFATGSASLSMH